MTHAPDNNNDMFQDWHKADIVAALRKAGWSLRRLSVQHGYHPQSLKHALHRPWPLAERLIAEAIGVAPQVIWPTRYDENGRSNRRRGRTKSSPHEDNC